MERKEGTQEKDGRGVKMAEGQRRMGKELEELGGGGEDRRREEVNEKERWIA